MQQRGSNILPADPPSLALGEGIKRSKRIQLFQNMVMLHNKLKGIEHRAPWKHILSLWVGLKDKTNSECGHVAYQIKGKEV